MKDVGCDELSLEMCLTPPGKPIYRGGTGPPKKCTPCHDDDKVLRCFEFSLNEIYYQE